MMTTKEVRRAATRAGITQESIGEWLNIAARLLRLGHPIEALDGYRRALAIHDTWGKKDAIYSMCDKVLAHTRATISEIEAMVHTNV